MILCWTSIFHETDCSIIFNHFTAIAPFLFNWLTQMGYTIRTNRSDFFFSSSIFSSLHWQECKEMHNKTLLAERILLNTLGFDLQLVHPYRTCLDKIKDALRCTYMVICDYFYLFLFFLSLSFWIFYSYWYDGGFKRLSTAPYCNDVMMVHGIISTVLVIIFSNEIHLN